LPARNEVVHAFSDHSKVEKIFEYTPRVDLDEGIQRMASWVRQHGTRQSHEFGQIEISRGLPPSWRKDQP
jgi:UDP-glucose 4-epimerase